MNRVRSKRIITSLDSLLTFPIDGVCPSGFIFHVGRCGSTMVSNVIDQVPSNYVLKEPQPLSAALAFWAMHAGTESRQGEAIFRVLMNVFVSHFKRNNPNASVFIKFPSWASSYMRFVIDAYPEIPLVFISRNPEHVVVSMLSTDVSSKLLSYLPFASSVSGVSLEQIQSLPIEEFLAIALNKYMEQAILHFRKVNYFVVDYTGLKAMNLIKMLQFFNIRQPNNTALIIERALRYYSKDKNKTKLFKDDSEIKEKVLTPQIKRIIKQHTDCSYRKLVTLSSV